TGVVLPPDSDAISDGVELFVVSRLLALVVFGGHGNWHPIEYSALQCDLDLLPIKFRVRLERCILCPVLRYILYPKIFIVIIFQPTQSLCLGAFPMDLHVLLFLRPSVDRRDCLVYLECLDVRCYCIGRAATGGIVADDLLRPQLALGTILAIYILWGIGVSFSLMVICIYLQRLMLYKLPPRAMLVSVFLPLGPLGQGGFGIQKFGKSAKSISPQTQTLSSSTGKVFYRVGFLISILAVGIWACLAHSRMFLLNMDWWALTFLLGVFTTCTCTMDQEFPPRFFSGVWNGKQPNSTYLAMLTRRSARFYL
ncbi:sulfite efflux pump SSU1, partial [Penicillium argentinense]